MSKKAFERHPLSVAMGEMEPDAFLTLQDSIGNLGVLDPAILFQGKILDGWHRYTVASGLGMDCPMVPFAGEYADAIDLVWAKHGARRNWNASQRAQAQANLMVLRRGDSAPGAVPTVAEAAEKAGVSPRTMHQALRVAEKGSKELNDAVMDGVVSVKQAAQVTDLPKREQAKAATAPKPRPTRPADSAPGADHSKTAPGAVPLPRPVVGASLEAMAELKERVDILVEENDRLTDRLAVVTDPTLATDEERAEARAHVEQLRRDLVALQATHAGLKALYEAVVAEKQELMRQCAMYRNQLTRRAA